MIFDKIKRPGVSSEFIRFLLRVYWLFEGVLGNDRVVSNETWGTDVFPATTLSFYALIYFFFVGHLLEVAAKSNQAVNLDVSWFPSASYTLSPLFKGREIYRTKKAGNRTEYLLS